MRPKASLSVTGSSSLDVEGKTCSFDLFAIAFPLSSCTLASASFPKTVRSTSILEFTLGTFIDFPLLATPGHAATYGSPLLIVGNEVDREAGVWDARVCEDTG